ncbi:Phospholipase A2 inhibitor subunit gamma B, partial [Buceros rhinoceros silvestris]
TSLQCEVCHSVGRSCSGPMRTCNDGEDTCGIVLQEVAMGGMIIPSSLKSCMQSSLCSLGPTTMNFGNVKARSHVVCCTGNKCKTTVVSLPPEENVPNGYQCPACYSVDSFQCSDKIINCSGSETQCVDVAGLMNSGNYLLFGAVFHLFGGKNSLGALDIMFKRFECKPASVMALVSSGFTPSRTFFLPVLLGFILEEVL